MDVVAAVVAIVLAVAVVVVAVRSLLGAGSDAAALRTAVRRPRAWLVVLPGTVLVLALGVPYAYVEWGQDEAPPPLAFEPIDDGDDTSTRTPPVAVGSGGPGTTAPFAPPAGGTTQTAPASTAAPAPATSEVDGTWRVGRGSVAGYRAEEVLLVQDNVAVGRTDDVSGEMTIADTTVTAAEYVVDMRTVTSDQPMRDERYREIMDTAHHPTSRFVLTTPIELGQVPPEGEVVTRKATGRFTIRGVTRTATFDLKARRVEGRIEVLGSIPVTWSDHGIPDPGNGFVRVRDRGTIELLLYLDRA